MDEEVPDDWETLLDEEEEEKVKEEDQKKIVNQDINNENKPSSLLTDSCRSSKISNLVNLAKLADDEHLKNSLTTNDVQDKCLSYYRRVADSAPLIVKKIASIRLMKQRPTKIDLCNNFNASDIFCVDGDSLMLSVLKDENLNWSFGGQMLHFIYLVERKLNMFVEKGGRFHVLFFSDNNVLWQSSPTLLLFRNCLIQHLKVNIETRVIDDISSVRSDMFKSYLSAEIPTFMLMTEGYVNSKCTTPEIKKLSASILHWQMDYVLSLNVDVALLNDIEAGISSLNGYYVESNKSFTLVYEKYIKEKAEHLYPEILKYFLKDKVFEVDLKDNCLGIELNAAILFIEKYKDRYASRLIAKLFIVYVLFKERLPIQNRSYPSLKPSDLLSDIIRKVHSCLVESLQFASTKQLDIRENVGDLWDGNLFATIISFFVEKNEASFNDIMSGTMLEKYHTILCHIGLQSRGGDKLEVFQSLMKVQKLHKKLDSKFVNVFIPINSKLVNAYAGGIYSSVECVESCIKEPIPKSKKFEDIYHWHCKVLIADDLERKKQEETTIDKFNDKPKSSFQKLKMKRNKERKKHQLPRFYEVYGGSMSSIAIKKKVLSISDVKVDQGGKKLSSTETLKQSISQQKKDEQEIKERELWKNLCVELDKPAGSVKKIIVLQEKAIEKLNKVKVQFHSPLLVKEVLIKQVNCYMKLQNVQPNCQHEVSIFLLVRELWIDFRQLLTDDDRQNLVTIISDLGFTQLSVLFIQSFTSTEPNRCHFEFQMEYMSDLLLRDVRTDPDLRVEGFIPDTWQRELLNAVDNNQSALIVAPTSSGKTYSSKYCMKKILRSNVPDDMVVYVSPTKALCNQVSAMAYAAFKHISMPRNMTLCGFFTRDARSNVENCKILVTVPQCLEILLLSPAGYKWAKKIKYVIFDEVHCIGMEDDGAEVWERLLLLISCPFLALSATIENPHDLHQWLQNVQNFQYENREHLSCNRNEVSYEVKLVIVTERHSDLKTHLFHPDIDDLVEKKASDSSLKHLHPCSSLNIVSVAEKGIPVHLTLSAVECIQLYRAMIGVWSKNRSLRKFVLNTYFNVNKRIVPQDPQEEFQHFFLSRSDVARYGFDLKKELGQWAITNPSMFTAVLSAFSTESPSDIVNEPPSYVTLVETLKKQDRLPVIIFRLDKHGCEEVVNEVVMHCERAENEYQSQNKLRVTKTEKRQAKKQQQKHDVVKSEKKGESNNLDEFSIYSTRREDSCDDISWLEPQHSGVTYRGVGKVSSEDLEYLYKRLYNMPTEDLFMRGIRHGIGYHHSGMDNKLRSTVEILFRWKFLNIVVATSTLALGVHVPCRSVVLVEDSPYLTPLMYRQMAGRSGRRGFDNSGTVIFNFSISEKRINRLVTGNLSHINGNFPISVSLCLRLLILVYNVKGGEIAQRDTLTRVLCMLKHPMILARHPELDAQFKYFFIFAVQFFMREGMVDTDAIPQGFAGFAAHLHYHEPGSYAFISALKAGLFHRLCESKNVRNQDGKFCELFLRYLVMILSHYFTNTAVHKKQIVFSSSLVYLPPLPAVFKKDLECYNKRVKKVFYQYLVYTAKYCGKNLPEDNTLPLSNVSFPSVKSFQPCESKLEQFLLLRCHKNEVCSSFAGLSCHSDHTVKDDATLLKNIRHQVFTDVNIIPMMSCDVPLNSYALDFFKHGQVKALIRENLLKSGYAYAAVKDFMLTLKTIAVSMEIFTEENKSDSVRQAFKQLADEYGRRFQEASPRW